MILHELEKKHISIQLQHIIMSCMISAFKKIAFLKNILFKDATCNVSQNEDK